MNEKEIEKKYEEQRSKRYSISEGQKLGIYPKDTDVVEEIYLPREIREMSERLPMRGECPKDLW